MASNERAWNIWTYGEAKLKCSEKHSCFIEIQTQEHMSLSPYYIGRIKQGIQEQIECKLQRWKFLEEYGGIIVAYDNIKLLQRSAEIYDESPELHFDIKVNYIIFKPEVGNKLVGVVNKTSASHVGCLVHGRFNASLAKPRSCKNGWVGTNLEIGTEFIFRVSELTTVAGVLSIAGHIKEKDMKYIKYGNTKSTEKLSSELSESSAESKIATKRNHEEKLDMNKNWYKKETKLLGDPSRPEDNSFCSSESGAKTNAVSVKKRKKKKSGNE